MRSQQSVAIDELMFQRRRHVQQHQRAEREGAAPVRGLQRLGPAAVRPAPNRAAAARRTTPPESPRPSCSPSRPAARRRTARTAAGAPRGPPCAATPGIGAVGGRRHGRARQPRRNADSARIVMPAHLCQLKSLSRVGEIGRLVHVDAEREVGGDQQREQPVRGDGHAVVVRRIVGHAAAPANSSAAAPPSAAVHGRIEQPVAQREVERHQRRVDRHLAGGGERERARHVVQRQLGHLAVLVARRHVGRQREVVHVDPLALQPLGDVAQQAQHTPALQAAHLLGQQAGFFPALANHRVVRRLARRHAAADQVVEPVRVGGLGRRAARDPQLRRSAVRDRRRSRCNAHPR